MSFDVLDQVHVRTFERATPGAPWLIDAAVFVHMAYQIEIAQSKLNDGPVLATLDPGVNATGPRLLSFIRDILTRFCPTHAIAAWDGPPSGHWRRAADPNYKSNRPPKAPGLRELFKAAPALIAELGIRSVSADGHEADDVIASACARHPSCVIVSVDKDFYQVLGLNNARIWDPRKKRTEAAGETNALVRQLTADDEESVFPGAWITHEDVLDKFGVHPSRVVDVQAIMGDSADKVPGAARVGRASAAALVAHYGSLDKVLSASLADAPPALAKLLARVHASRDAVELSRRLVTLETGLPVDIYPVTTVHGDPMTLTNPFKKPNAAAALTSAAREEHGQPDAVPLLKPPARPATVEAAHERPAPPVAPPRPTTPAASASTGVADVGFDVTGGETMPAPAPAPTRPPRQDPRIPDAAPWPEQWRGKRLAEITLEVAGRCYVECAAALRAFGVDVPATTTSTTRKDLLAAISGLIHADKADGAPPAADAPATARPSVHGRLLIVNALGNVALGAASFADLIRPLESTAAESLGVPYVQLAEFSKGPKYVASLLYRGVRDGLMTLPSVLEIDTGHPCGRECLAVLTEHYPFVVRGIG